MPLPASVPTGTVSGTWYTPSGNLAVGEIIFLLLAEVEIPDDPDGVVIPVRHEVAVPAGQLSVTLPAGYYNVLVRLSDLYYKPKVIRVTAGENLNLPDAIGVVPVEDLVTPVRSVNGEFPDSAGNIEINTGGGGGGAVDSVFGRTGAVAAQSGDYTLSQITGLQAALDGKEDDGTAANAVGAHVAAADPHPQYALDIALAEVATSGDYADLTGTPTIPSPVKGFGTTGKITGTFGPGDTSGTWTVSPAQWRVSVPAVVGDILCLDPSVIAQVTADAEMDVCSLNGNTPLRYYSSGTTSQAPNGHGGLYIGTQFSTELGSIRWVVTADDIVAGTVTLAYMYRSGSGVTWGSGAYPNEITLINEGKP